MWRNSMKAKFRLVKIGRRGGTYYIVDRDTGERQSLNTKSKTEAAELLTARIEAHRDPAFNLHKARLYMAASDPQVVTRTWGFVMEDIIKDKTGPTLRRYRTALKDAAYELIKAKPLLTTLPEDLLKVLRTGTTCTNVYLRRFQNHAVGMGWLPVPILPKKQFPKIVHGEKRSITWEEHGRIIAREANPERRDFYDLCWYLGGSQTDVANLQAADIDYERRGFCYSRRKTSSLGGMHLGAKAWEVIMRRPRTGPLFPYLITVREADRATEFKQRCQGLGIKGVTLHSYRYAWAERSADSGYHERYAQRALGQNSKMVHRAYARRAQAELPSLEDYEEASQKAKQEHKIVLLVPEVSTPKVA
jgi:integrase